MIKFYKDYQYLKMDKKIEKIITNNKKISKRSLSRLIAVQTLYQYDYLTGENNDILNLMTEMVDNYLIDAQNDEIASYRKKIDMKFLTELLENITDKLTQIDEIIEKSIKTHHDFNKIQDVMLAILRLGIFELKFINKTPFKVVINEYVDIANAFYDKNRVDFVNAILNKSHE
jgi:transcription antitermination protein NusB